MLRVDSELLSDRRAPTLSAPQTALEVCGVFHLAMSTIPTSVCVSLTVAVLANRALGYGTSVSRSCLIYSGVAAAASSAAVMGLVLLTDLPITQTLLLMTAIAVAFALIWEYAGFEAYSSSTCSIAGTSAARVWAPIAGASIALTRAAQDRSDEPGGDRHNMIACVAAAEAPVSIESGPPDSVEWLVSCAESLAVRPEERDLLVRACREGADLGEVDGALRVLMRLLIHPTAVHDLMVRAKLVDHQRCLHARHAALRAQAHGQSGGIGRSAVEAQAQARLARLNSLLGREYSDD